MGRKIYCASNLHAASEVGKLLLPSLILMVRQMDGRSGLPISSGLTVPS
jgi:hypothetical protein